MKHLLSSLSICSLFIIYPFLGHSQRIAYGSPKVDKDHKEIKIPYTIEESSEDKYRYLYDITVSFSQDQEASNFFGLPSGELPSISGGIGDDLLSGEHEITWGYLADDSTFNGQNVRFKLDVTYKPNPFYLKGPEAAFYSLVLPGWGQTKVRPEARYWYASAVGAFSLIGTGLYLRSRASTNFDRYLASTTLQETQSFFDKSNNQRRIGGVLLIAGGVVWATDIIRVFWKGRKNKKERDRLLKDYPDRFQRLISEDPKLCKKYGKKFDLQCLIDYNFERNQPVFGMQVKF